MSSMNHNYPENCPNCGHRALWVQNSGPDNAFVTCNGCGAYFPHYALCNIRIEQAAWDEAEREYAVRIERAQAAINKAWSCIVECWGIAQDRGLSDSGSFVKIMPKLGAYLEQVPIKPQLAFDKTPQDVKLKFEYAQEWFFEFMEDILREKAPEKTRWTSPDVATGMLCEELKQRAIEIASNYSNPHHHPGYMTFDLIRDCAHVANYAMMIADKLGPLEKDREEWTTKR